MASTGNVFAGTGENNAGIGATAWTNPGNITSDNATDATCAAAASSQYLVARNFDFSSIPSNATITGILVRVEASEHSPATEPLLAQLQNDSGTLFGSSKSTSNEGSISGTGKSVYTYGSTSDVWGATLTRAIVTDPDFGVRFWFTTSHDIRIDYVTMAVEYTVPAVDDTEADWWAGAMLCMAGLAIAGTLAGTLHTSRLAASFQEEQVDAANLKTMPFDGDLVISWRSTYAQSNIRFLSNGNSASVAAAEIVDTTEHPLARPWYTWKSSVVTDDDVITTQVPSTVDEDYWHGGVVLPAPQLWQVAPAVCRSFQDDEQIVPQQYSRLYFWTPELSLSVPSFDSWDSTSNMQRWRLLPTQYPLNNTSISASSSGTADAKTGIVQLVSRPLLSGISFNTSDRVKLQICVGEVVDTANIDRCITSIRVFSRDLLTLRATLKSIGHHSPSTTEWPSAFRQNRSFLDGDYLDANYTTVPGDRLVIELGGQVSSGGGTNTNISLQGAANSGSPDLPEDETDTNYLTKSPWFDITRELLYEPIVDEDYWQNPTAPALWQIAPSVCRSFQDDEQIVAQVVQTPTRLYFDPTVQEGAAYPSPSSDAGWDFGSASYSSRLVSYLTGHFGVASSAGVPATANAESFGFQFISDPLVAGISFQTNDTIKCQIGVNENDATTNINRNPISVRVFSRDCSTLRATLKYLGHYGPSTTEWEVSPPTNRTYADGDFLDQNYTTVEGDRLVVEFGAQVDATGSTGTGWGVWQLSTRFGVSDLPENETENAGLGLYRPWFEISRTLSFVLTDEDYVWPSKPVVHSSWLNTALLQHADDVIVAYTATIVEEEYWRNLVVPALWQTNKPIIWDEPDSGNLHSNPTVDEDFRGPVASPRLWAVPPVVAITSDGSDVRRFFVEEEYSGPVLPAPKLWWTPPVVAKAIEEDWVKPNVDEDFWRNAVAPSLWWNTNVVANDPSDNGNLHTNPTVDEDFPGPLPSPQLWWANGIVLWGDPVEWVTPPAVIYADEDFWWLFGTPMLWQVPPVQAIIDDGQSLGNLHTNNAVDEDIPGPTPAPQLWQTNGLLLWGDESVWVTPAPLTIDEEENRSWPAPRLWNVPPIVAFTDDDVTRLPLTVDDEENRAWPAPRLWYVPPVVAFVDDDVTTELATIVEVETGVFPAPQWHKYRLFDPRLVQDERPTPAAPLTIEEDYDISWIFRSSIASRLLAPIKQIYWWCPEVIDFEDVSELYLTGFLLHSVHIRPILDGEVEIDPFIDASFGIEPVLSGEVEIDTGADQ